MRYKASGGRRKAQGETTREVQGVRRNGCQHKTSNTVKRETQNHFIGRIVFDRGSRPAAHGGRSSGLREGILGIVQGLIGNKSLTSFVFHLFHNKPNPQSSGVGSFLLGSKVRGIGPVRFVEFPCLWRDQIEKEAFFSESSISLL